MVEAWQNSLAPNRHRYLAARTARTAPPDLVLDPRAEVADEGGWIGATSGGLFDGRTVGWRALTVMDSGIDIECVWDHPVWLDRLLVDPAVLEQVDRIRVLVPDGSRLRQVGQVSQVDRRSDEFVLEADSTIGADVGHLVTRCVIRIETRLADVRIVGGLRWFGVRDFGLGIFPSTSCGSTEATASIGGGAFADLTVIPYGDTAEQFAQTAVARAAEVLDQQWRTARCRNLPDTGVTGVLVLQLPGTTASNDISTRWDSELATLVDEAAELEADGFVVRVDHDGVVIAGDELGLRFGLEAVLQQLAVDGGIALGHVVDEPVHSFRAVHLPLPGPSQVDYFRRLIRNVVVPARYNTVIVEIAGGMEFTRHPEINECWMDLHARAVAGEIPMPPHFRMVAPGECLPQSVTAELMDELRTIGLDVIPEIQSLSHVQYLVLAHPELAEVSTGGELGTIDLFLADRHEQRYPSCYCPSNPLAHEFMADIVEEILDVFRPQRWVHLGHDEVLELGRCDRCATEDPATLFADDVRRLCALVSERDLRPMMWADMLQPDSHYKTAGALDDLPEDVVLMDFIWYFHRERDTEVHLLDHGREVIIGNLYSSHFPRWLERSRRQGILGGQVSTWVSLDDERMAREGKYFDIAMVGVMLWSRRYHRHHRPGLSARISRWMETVRRAMTGNGREAADAGLELLRGRVAELTGEETVTVESCGTAADDPEVAALLARAGSRVTVPADRGDSTVHTIADALCLPHSGAAGGGTMQVDVPEGLTEIHLLHALVHPVSRVPWEPLAEVGRYRFLAADGTELGVVPVTAGGTAGQLHRRPAEPLPTSLYRHQGYTATYRCDVVNLGQTDDGKDLTLYRVSWRAPHRAPAVASITLDVHSDAGSSVLVAAITGHGPTDLDRTHSTEGEPR